MRSTIHARMTQSAAVLAAGSVSMIVLAHLVAPAAATTGPLTYTCNGPLTGAFDLPVEIDSSAPARTYAGERFTVVATAALPGSLAEMAYDDLGARSFSGTLTHQVAVGTTVTTLTHAVAETAIPDQATPTGVPFAATAPLSLGVPGDVVLEAGDFDATLSLADGTGQPAAVPSVAFACTVPSGPARVIDTVVVAARSATALTLSRTTSSYGEAVTATARVTTTAGAPAGQVAFVVDGLARKARVDKDGVATLDITDARTGAHTVTATFVPDDPGHYDTSASPAVTWTVGRATSRIATTITGKRTTRATRVAVRVGGAFGTEATGKVRIRLTRLGTRKGWLRVRTLAGGRATARFARLPRGRYQVAAVHRGDAGHLASKRVVRFRVRKG